MFSIAPDFSNFQEEVNYPKDEKASTATSHVFRFKDKVPLCLRSNIVYKFACGGCNTTYYGEICRHYKVRVMNSQIFHL